MFDNLFSLKPRAPKRYNFSLTPEEQEMKINEEDPTEPGFMSKYRELTNNHPYLDQYKTEMENEPNRENYRPGKLGRLGAILAGASASFKNPAEGVRLTKELVDSKFNDAKAEHKEKLNRLRDLSSYEQDSLGRDISALTTEQNFKNQDKEFGLKKDMFTEDKSNNAVNRKYTQTQIDSLNDEVAHRGETVQVNDITGDVELVNTRSGQRKSIGKFKQSANDRLNDSLREISAKGLADKSIEEMRGQTARDVAKIGANSREAVATTKASAKSLRDESSRVLKAEPQKARMLSAAADVAEAFPDVDIQNLMNGALVKPDDDGLFGDSLREKEAKKMLREALAAVAKDPNVKAPAATNTSTPNTSGLTEQEIKEGWKITPSGIKYKG